MNENINLAYVIYSPTESAVSDGAGFWSNDVGWAMFDQATQFSKQETQTVNLPESMGSDAKWMPLEEANSSHGAPSSETLQVRMTLDVTYSLNGENATEMVGRLRKMCERAIGEGMLTGETDAEVDVHSLDVVIQP